MQSQMGLLTDGKIKPVLMFLSWSTVRTLANKKLLNIHIVTGLKVPWGQQVVIWVLFLGLFSSAALFGYFNQTFIPFCHNLTGCQKAPSSYLSRRSLSARSPQHQVLPGSPGLSRAANTRPDWQRYSFSLARTPRLTPSVPWLLVLCFVTPSFSFAFSWTKHI